MVTAYTVSVVPQPELSTASVWEVIGGHEPYVVKLADDGCWGCSCPHYLHRGHRGRFDCKHIRAVKESYRMDADAFRALVRRLREKQKDYFKTRNTITLGEAKELERRVDQELDRDRHPTLFNDSSVPETTARATP